MAEITIRHVRKAYGRNEVVHGLDLTIERGEFVVILDPSGCGKSTLLRMIAGLEEISAGEIAIDGVVVNRLEPRARGCAMVFQNYALYPHMTVAENIGYALKVAVEDPLMQDLPAALDEAQTLDVELVELPIHRLDIVAGGRILRQRLAAAREMTRGRPLHYTLHGHLGINLMEEPFRLALHRELLRVNIEVAADLARRAALAAVEPDRFAWPVPYEPLFGVLADHGYDWSACNAPGPTQRTRPDGTPRPPFAKLDWFFARGLACSEAAILAAVDAAGTALSDHEAIIVTIRPA
jgi:ABC-type nitrate/sulfonate/bicarbonate transport system ATPase subunit